MEHACCIKTGCLAPKVDALRHALRARPQPACRLQEEPCSSRQLSQESSWIDGFPACAPVVDRTNPSPVSSTRRNLVLRYSNVVSFPHVSPLSQASFCHNQGLKVSPPAQCWTQGPLDLYDRPSSGPVMQNASSALQRWRQEAASVQSAMMTQGQKGQRQGVL